MTMPDARMIGMRMGDDGSIDRPPGIDVEIARRAVQSFPAGDNHVLHGDVSLDGWCTMLVRINSAALD